MATIKKKKEDLKNQAPTSLSFKPILIYALLSIIVLGIYSTSINNGLTELDDQIFIKENIEYNKDISNIITSFKRGVFAVKKDTYYRPLLLNSFVLNYQINKDRIMGYHLFNVFMHLLSVFLLYKLLIKLKLPDLTALLLTIIFAVHPTLSQAVSWIPGRNDSILAVFTFGFILSTINYCQSRKWVSIIASFLFLLAAMYTKESALFVPFGTFLLLALTEIIQWREKRNAPLYLSWMLALFIWFISRLSAGLQSESYTFSTILSNSLDRVPILIHYFGKTILPFNLNVFPLKEDTSYAYGIAAILIVGALLYFSDKPNKKIVLAGFSWFILMLLPVVLLPSSLNNQEFEHRLYVPFLGVLLILSQTILFTKFKPAISSSLIIGIVVLFAGINIKHQTKFKNPVTFWTAAVQSSPHSAYATMMLAARLDDTEIVKSKNMMLKAYELNPKEKYINFYLGKMYNDGGEKEKAEKYLLEELRLSAYYETYFQLSKIEFEKKNLDKSISYMEMYLQKAPDDKMAVSNYILMLSETGQKQKAQQFAQQRQNQGKALPKELTDLIFKIKGD